MGDSVWHLPADAAPTSTALSVTVSSHAIVAPLSSEAPTRTIDQGLIANPSPLWRSTHSSQHKKNEWFKGPRKVEASAV
jgi:hypothetical protein